MILAQPEKYRVSFPTYSEYRESNVDWLGKIPIHWSACQLRYISSFTNGYAFKPSTWSDDGIPIIRIENLNGSDSFNFSKEYVPKDVLVHQGDLLFAWSGNRGTSFGPFQWSPAGDYYLNQHIFKLSGFNVNKRWFYWVLKGVTEHVERQAHGIIGLVHITKQELGSIKIPVIPSKEQASIANFLDYETAKIDAMIAKKERLIALLEEKRTALISHVVTKGLNPTVSMKDSGMEWLGSIPVHWSLKRLRHISPNLSVGLVINPSTHVSDVGTIPFLFGSNIQEFHINSEDSRRITQESNQALSASMLHEDDIVTVRVGYPGISAVIPKELDGSNCASMMITRGSPKFDSWYLCYCMNSRIGRYQVELVQYGAAQKQFNISHAVNFIYPVPPLEEQRRIAASLKEKTAKISDAIASNQRMLDLLKEKRSALITAAVTGKIDSNHQFRNRD